MNSSVFFSQILDDKHTSTRDAEGAYFISADVAPMRIVLKYLETGKLTFAPALKDELIDLADMLCLEQLVVEVRGGFNPFLLRAEVYSKREDEREWHRRLSSPDDSFEGQATVADAALVDVAARKADFRFSSTPLGSGMALLFDCRQEVLTEDAPTIQLELFSQPAKPQFREALNRFAERWDVASPEPSTLLDKLDLSNVVIAGGAVLRVLLGHDLSVDAEGDLDLFLVGLDDEAAMWDKVKAIFASLKEQVAAEHAALPNPQAWQNRDKRDILAVRSTSAITFVLPSRRSIQVMLTRYSCVADVLLNFDIDTCQVAFDGERVLCTHAAMRAINHRVLLADPTIRHRGYESRLRKYALRGFGVAVAGLDVSRISHQLLTGSWATFSGELCRYKFEVELSAAEIYREPDTLESADTKYKLYSIGSAVPDLAKLVVFAAYDAADFTAGEYPRHILANSWGGNQLAAPLDDRLAPEELLFRSRRPDGYATIPIDRLRGLTSCADEYGRGDGIRELDVSNHGHTYTDPETQERRPLFMDLEASSDGLGTLLTPGRPSHGAEKLGIAYAVARIPPVVWDLVVATNNFPSVEAALPYVSDAAFVPQHNPTTREWDRDHAAAAFGKFYEGKLPRKPTFPRSHEAEFLQRPENDWFEGVYKADTAAQS